MLPFALIHPVVVGAGFKPAPISNRIAGSKVRKSPSSIKGMPAMAKPKRRSAFGRKLEAGLKEALAYARGEAKPGSVRVSVIEPVDVKAIRDRLGLTQAAFERFGFSLDTLRKWEQGQTVPGRPPRAYLRVIARNPKAVEEALAE
jgi:putative transcriptional regulator